MRELEKGSLEQIGRFTLAENFSMLDLDLVSRNTQKAAAEIIKAVIVISIVAPVAKAQHVKQTACITEIIIDTR
uniref:Uncharacterized protein n=1 Tax=Pristionchus pacificus TaxID=54126 RepID=A0A2A6C3C2_PRIPA|eukprot:PDM72675.1 hypothetical protein PRIPAC_39109 [Pristionchus pacificus]